MALTFVTDSEQLKTRPVADTTLADLVESQGLMLDRRCGGNGVCRGCLVQLQRGRYLVNGECVDVAEGETLEALACRTSVISEDACVRIPAASLIEHSAKIETEFRVGVIHAGPRTTRHILTLEEPVLENAPSDRERLETALARVTHDSAPITLPHSLVGQLPTAIAEGKGTVTVTVAHLEREQRIVALTPGEANNELYGIAVDIGTTTVVASLINLRSGDVLANASLYNQQIIRADDVASRISYCHNPEHREEMRRLVVDRTINPLIEDVCTDTGIQPDQILRVSVAGNTVMSHLFYGYAVDSIGRLPFNPVTCHYDALPAHAVGVSIAQESIVECLPSVAGYVGGDIVADILVSDMMQDAGNVLLVDIGTNGEMVYAENGRLWACATAAGPAFEGAGLMYGCRAAAGAIESIIITPSLEFEVSVIGNHPATGICGSGIVDFLAQARRAGLINTVGRFDIDTLKQCGRYHRIEDDGTTAHACIVVKGEDAASGTPILITEYDISQVLKAKAATFAGMQSLLNARKQTFDGLNRVVLAGGFAKHIKIENGIAIGLLPDLPADRFDVIGNGSLAGALMAMVDPSAYDALTTIAGTPKVIELNLMPEFEHNFVDALSLPEED